MRESCFRGKKLDNGEWVYGFLLICDERYFIIPETKIGCVTTEWLKKGEYGFYGFVEVDPATVGRYTGLTANGKKIFEGDVFRYGLLAVAAVAVVKFGEYSFGSQFDMNCVGFYLEWTPRAMLYRKDLGFWVKQREIEIIGNIHDNPELLEEVQ